MRDKLDGMKKFAIGYAILAALLISFFVHDHIQAHLGKFCIGPAGDACHYQWREIITCWIQFYGMVSIPLVVILAMGLILKGFRIYNLSRAIYISLILMTVWFFSGAPTSISEAIFYVRLNYLASSNAEEINLGKIMYGNWEMVCQSDGYDGPVHIEKYDRWYQPTGYPQDGYWGLIFISPDGSYTSATGNDVSLALDGCVERSKAVLHKQGDAYVLPDEAKTVSGVRFI